jgi:osmotically-inducible protein OsmY
MNTSQTNISVTEEDLNTSEAITEEELEEEEAHIHLPGPSFWPALLGVAIAVVFVGVILFGTPGHDQLAGLAPWFIFIGLPLVLIGIMGWALENPHGAAPGAQVRGGRYSTSFADASITGKPTVFADQVLDEAEAAVESAVTIGSTAWSAHPVKVFVEREGVVLSLYGKVELEAQKQEVEKAVRQIPGVLDVMNFLVAEDDLLNTVNSVIDGLKSNGKLEGATDLSVLVENGIVSLYGIVPNTSMKYLLEREISGVPGARVVINHIGLNKDIPGNLGRTTNRIGRI